MDWTTAWQLAGEICDIIGDTTSTQHEQIASLLQQRDGYIFNSHIQKWERVNYEGPYGYPYNRDD